MHVASDMKVLTLIFMSMSTIFQRVNQSINQSIKHRCNQSIFIYFDVSVIVVHTSSQVVNTSGEHHSDIHKIIYRFQPASLPSRPAPYRPADTPNNRPATYWTPQHPAMGSGGGDLCPGLIWAILWFLGLIFIGWPVGFLVAWLYIFLLPFGACIEPVQNVTDVLLKVVNLPYTFAKNMVDMKPCGG